MAPERMVLATADGPTPATIARPEPETEPRGGALVLHEAFGLTDYVADVCRRFAAAGWTAVAPSLFHRHGSPVFDYDDVDRAAEKVSTLTVLEILDDVDAGLRVLAEEGTAIDRVAIVGFCMGGTIAFQAAVHRPFGAAVTFYGSGIRRGRFGEAPLADLASRLQAPWLGLYGDRDASIPVSEVDELWQAAQSAAVNTKVVRYPDAGHGFHCDARASYHAPSATDAWARTLTWLDAHVPAS